MEVRKPHYRKLRGKKFKIINRVNKNFSTAYSKTVGILPVRLVKIFVKLNPN